MSVPKGKRKQSRFEAQHRFFILRQEVTKLIMNSFGFSKEKYEKQIERYRQTHMSAPNVDEVVERWKRKCEEFYRMETIEGIQKEAEKLGLFVNQKKTRVCRLSETFTFLQIRYFLTDKGKVVKRINPKSVTRQRRRLKVYKRLMDAGKMTYPMIEQAYKSWMGAFTRIMSKKQIEHIKELYKSLYGKEPRWKK